MSLILHTCIIFIFSIISSMMMTTIIIATPTTPVEFSYPATTPPYCLVTDKLSSTGFTVKPCDASVNIKERNSFNFNSVNDGGVRAVAMYSRNTSTTGWDFFEVIPDIIDHPKTTTSVASLRNAYYYAGYLEGYLTATNLTQINMPGQEESVKAKSMDAWNFVQTQINFMNTSAFNNASLQTDKYWNRVSMIMKQLEGMRDGYNANPDQPGAGTNNKATFGDVFLRAYYFELEFDILPKFTNNNNNNNNDNDNDESTTTTPTLNLQPTHCSALIKLTKDDILVAHTSWFIFENMRRIMKLYIFDSSVQFSSYVGFVMSGDDHYMIRGPNSELAVFETSLSVFNNSLSSLVSPYAVSEFVRVMVANYISTNTEEWGANFARLNSGTYNNMFSATDYKLYTPGMTTLPKNTVQIYEQIPGKIIKTDVSAYISENGYFASYNIAYDNEIWTEAGYGELEAQYGSFFGYFTTTRALIFKRNQSMIETIADTQRMIRYNNWEVDPLSKIPNCEGTLPVNNSCTPDRSPALSICQRHDIAPTGNRTTMGPLYNSFIRRDSTAYDGKVASYKNRKNLYYYGISGPPVNSREEQESVLPPFVFSENAHLFDNGTQLPPEGLPDRWDFPWVLKMPACPSCVEFAAISHDGSNNNNNDDHHSLWGDKQSVGALIGGFLGLIGVILVVAYLKRSRPQNPNEGSNSNSSNKINTSNVAPGGEYQAVGGEAV